ncbi:MAG: hypothetical protein AB1752_04650 [Candidatus Zixiibacteriota bacterium]
MNRIQGTLIFCLAGVLMAAFGAGCSHESPFEPSIETMSSRSWESQAGALTPAGDPLQVTGRVESIDWDALRLTLAGYEHAITATEDCDIALIAQGDETPISFSEINVGDSLLACGTLLESGAVLAHRIRVFGVPTCDPIDVGFRGIIATIDYAAGTFTVADRPETILTDENTVIWTKVEVPRNGMAKTGGPGTTGPNYNHARFYSIYDSALVFSDLKVGDSVVVKAEVVDETTLLAVSIKLPGDCLVRSVVFTDELAAVDVTTRTVLFETESWIGFVCANALLTDAVGTSLTLADFAAADLVYVKGHPVSTDTLQICEMIKQ